MRTLGFSKKVAATVAAACGAQLAALLANYVATGEFDRVEVAGLVGIALTALAGIPAGWAAPPNEVVVKDAIPAGSVEP